MSSFKLLSRLFKEQCVIEEGENEAGKKGVARPNKDVPTDSLQNPSDPDAGYSGHKGKRYQAQIVENYTEDDTCSPPQKKTRLNRINHSCPWYQNDHQRCDEKLGVKHGALLFNVVFDAAEQGRPLANQHFYEV